MMGGITVDSKATAKAVALFPEMEGQRIRVGQRIRLAPCVPDAQLAVFAQREGRKCPRVELRPENIESQELFAILQSEKTRPLAQGWIADNLSAFTTEERTRIVNRTIRATLSPKVNAAFTNKPASLEGAE